MLFVVALAVSATTSSASFYVSSSTGADTNSGTSASSPFKTLAKAKVEAAKTTAAPSSASTSSSSSSPKAVVTILPGDYYQPEPLVFTEEDSNVEWVGASPGAVIRGGVRLTGWTKSEQNPNIWKVKPPPSLNISTVTQLVAADRPATLARHPNYGSGWLYNWTSAKLAGGKAGFRWSEATGLPATFERTHLKVNVWHPYGYSELTGVGEVDFSTKEMSVSPVPHVMLVKIWVEGAVELLDAPGEWAASEDGFIHYWPADPAYNPNAVVTTAVSSPRIFDVRGASSAPGDVVHDIRFTNLTVVGSGWLRNFECEWANRMNAQPGVDPTGNWANTREGMFRLENASSISITGTKMRAVGTTAVWLEHYAQNVHVESNWIEDVAAWGVHINGWDLGGGRQPIPGSYEFATPSDANVNFGHVVSNNVIHNVGLKVTYGAGVYVHQSHSNTVTHNVIARSPRNLLSTFGVCYMYGGIGPYTTAVYPDKPPAVYGENITFLNQYDVTTSSNITFAYNDLSHACMDSQDCGVWEAWGPGRDNFIFSNSIHDHWATMGQAFTILFPDSSNNFFQVRGNVFFNNLQSGIAGLSPGGSTGMTAIGLKGYNQSFTDNIIADSSHNIAVWIGPSGGLQLGLIEVERNIFMNFSQNPQCAGGETSVSGSALCFRSVETVARQNVGQWLNASIGNSKTQNPAWWGFDSKQLADPVLSTVDKNVYQNLVEPASSTLKTLRPDIDVHSVGGVSAEATFARTPFSQWWNRSVLDYALLPSAAAKNPEIGFQETDLSRIGLKDDWPFEPKANLFVRSGWETVQTETADRAFGLYLEPSFGISYPTNPGKMALPNQAAFARYNNFEFSSGGGGGGGSSDVEDRVAKQIRVRVCTPLAAAGDVGAIHTPSSLPPAASAVVVRTGSPDGPVLAHVPLPPSQTAHANCGYLIGSYWAPGVMNDDPAAMSEVVVPVVASTAAVAGNKVDLFVSVVGGFAAVDWFRFEDGSSAFENL